MKSTSPSPSMSVVYDRKQLYNLANAAIAAAWEHICSNGSKGSEELKLNGINTNITAIEDTFDDVCANYNRRNRHYRTSVFWCDFRKAYVFIIRYEPDTDADFEPAEVSDVYMVVYSN